MKKAGKLFVFLFVLLMFLPAVVFAEETESAAPEYSEKSSWAYFANGADTGVDVFLLSPTVDYNDELNATLDDAMKTKFLTGISMEKPVYDGAGRIYAPYYRQMALAAYRYAFAEDKTQYVQAMNLAYSDVSAAFRYYLDHENNGRGIILAGFSQGSQMCLELLKEYYGGDSEEAVTLRKNLVSVYAIGWRLSQDTVDQYPQIVPATGEYDIGSVVSYDCENGELESTMIIPAGTKALSINPLNWKTDETEADKSLNLGALMLTTKEIIPGLCGAKIGSRGELIVTGVNTADFPPTIGGVTTTFFPEGHFHIYDYSFFLVNLKKNVISRREAWFKAGGTRINEISVEMGKGHEELAQKWADYLNNKESTIKNYGAAANGSTVSIKYVNQDSTLNSAKLELARSLVSLFGNTGCYLDNKEMLMPDVLAEQPAEHYKSMAEIEDENAAHRDNPLKEDQVLYVLWADKAISSVDMALEPPVCGTQGAAPKLTISGDQVIMKYYDWYDDQWEALEGKFKGGNTYRASLSFEPAYRYYLEKDIKVNLTGASFAGGKDKPSVANDGTHMFFNAEVKSEHKWDKGKITTQPTTEKEGVKTFTCEACGATKTEAVDKLSPTTPDNPVNPVKPVNPTAKEVLDTKLPKITIKKPVAKKKGFTAKWKKLSKKNRKKVGGIEIQYARNKKFTTSVKLVTAKKTATSKKISNLIKKKTYYVRIRTYKKVKGVKHFSKWSKVKKIKIR